MEIREAAFEGCTALTDVYVDIIDTWCGIVFKSMNANPMSVAENLYVGGEKLTELVIPSGVTEIGNYQFSGLRELVSVVIPDGVTSIGACAFDGCHSLVSVNIPNGVISIGGNAFNACYLLAEITIPDTVTSIGASAFGYCKALTEIVVPDSVTEIGSGAFKGCISLQSITVPFVGASLKPDSGYRYPFGYIFGGVSYTGGVATTQKYYNSTGSSVYSSTYYIPATLTRVTVNGGYIFKHAFYDCDTLTTIVFGDGVISIAEEALVNSAYYNDASNWENGALYVGKHLVRVDSATAGEFTVKSGTLTVAGEAFKDCALLTSVTVADSVRYIYGGAFAGCSSLESLTVPFVGVKVVAHDENSQYPLGYMFGRTQYDGSLSVTQYY